MKKISAIFLALALLFTVTAVACAEGPQTFTASSPGFGGDVEVTVTVDGGQITDVRITGDKETSGIGAVAVAELPTRILEAQSAEFDAWTGASFTSAAVKAALTEALAQASGKETAVPEAIMPREGSPISTRLKSQLLPSSDSFFVRSSTMG